MRRGQKEAVAAVTAYLQENPKPVMLFTLSNIADQAAYAKRKTELFPSLYDYQDILPDDWTTSWLSSSGSSDSLLHAIPRGWKPGNDNSTTLLMPGTLVHSQHLID